MSYEPLVMGNLKKLAAKNTQGQLTVDLKTKYHERIQIKKDQSR